MNAVIVRGDAACLPLADESVDLIVTSPPYWGQRAYIDERVVYDGQIGSEATPGEYIAALLRCTRDWMRVMKPAGSIFVNLGDKYGRGTRTTIHGSNSKQGYVDGDRPGVCAPTGYEKSLVGLPWRYAIGCMDQLSLILRRDIIWNKPNGLPESVTDRCRSAHEYLFHLVKQPSYYAAVDEIREAYRPETVRTQAYGLRGGIGGRAAGLAARPGNGALNPLGALPGSVWSIPSQPLIVPAHLGVDHFAAFPMELPRRVILGWSPSGICTECGEGRWPVTTAQLDRQGRTTNGPQSVARRFESPGRDVRAIRQTTIIGYACACTPYTDHEGSGELATRRGHNSGQPVDHPQGRYGPNQAGEYERVDPWREYHLDGWPPPPTRPAVVLDPFGGTGTTALVATVLGRTGITVDKSGDYCRLARWRTTDPGERARAMGVKKPPPVPDGQGSLFDEEVDDD